MSLNPSYKDLNHASTERIKKLVASLTDEQMQTRVGEHWTVAIALAHLAWWDKVVAHKKRVGEGLTILTEFGPPDYMPALPYTRQPVADQWAINVYMMHLLRKRYLNT